MKDPLSWVPIKFKLPLTFISICLVAFGVGGVVVTSTAQNALRDQIRLRLDERAAATRMVVHHHLNLLGRRAEDFASDGFIRTSLEALESGDASAGRPLRDHLVVNKLPLVAAFVDAAVLGGDGKPALEVYGGALGAAVERTSFTPLREPEAVRDYPSFAVSTPLWNLAGDTRIGTLVLQVEAHVWVAEMIELAELPESDGAMVAVRSGSAVLSLAGDATPPDPISYESTIPDAGWELVVAVSGGAITEPVQSLRNRFLSVAGVLLAVTALVLFFPVQFLLAPLGRIRDAARHIAAGDFSQRVEYASKDEIGDLSRAFDIMAEAVEERTQALEAREASIRFERDRLDAVIGSMHDGLFSIDPHGAVTFSNKAAEPLVEALSDDGGVRNEECAESDGRNCFGCLRAADLPRRACALEVAGRVYEVHVSPLPGDAGRLCVSRDITERVAQSRLQAHQERMSVLGNISAVMAHELNNPLAAIAMFSQMLESKLDEGTATHEAAEVIRRNAETCKRTIRGLLDTAVHADPERVEFDLDDLVDDVRRFLRPIWERANVEFVVERGEDALEPMGDELQLRQVLINLVMNAVHAIQDTPHEGGRVTVRTARDHGGCVIEVSDSGGGIPEGAQRQIFDPFFTTKAPSVGTGLGLSTSRRIVVAHGGRLDLHATGPDGTTFRIVLPGAAAPVAEEATNG